jgi:hypothetical protein
MPVKIVPTLRSSLERLKHAGLINGIALAWKRQPLCLLLPYESFRAEKLINTLHDAREHFTAGGRTVDTLWFGYDGVQVLATFREDTLLVLLHAKTEEVDFLSKVSSTFLSDAQLLIEASLNPSGSNDSAGETTLLKGSAPNAMF